eukprot:Skav224626  [mRNA]  locus=scaffold2059:213968:217210:- [translate_table: standard]
MDKGMLEVMHFPSLQPTFRERLSRAAERMSSLRFSPCGRYLAAGSWDQEARPAAGPVVSRGGRWGFEPRR